MARDRDDRQHRQEASREADGASGVPEFLRRAAAIGLSGFFTTEQAIRKALGDTVPQEWVDFASEQGERTRRELMDRLADEFGKILQNVDLLEFAEALLSGRTLEIEARIRLTPRGEAGSEGLAQAPPSGLRVAIEDD